MMAFRKGTKLRNRKNKNQKIYPTKNQPFNQRIGNCATKSERLMHFFYSITKDEQREKNLNKFRRLM